MGWSGEGHFQVGGDLLAGDTMGKGGQLPGRTVRPKPVLPAPGKLSSGEMGTDSQEVVKASASGEGAGVGERAGQ